MVKHSSQRPPLSCFFVLGEGIIIKSHNPLKPQARQRVVIMGMGIRQFIENQVGQNSLNSLRLVSTSHKKTEVEQDIGIQLGPSEV